MDDFDYNYRGGIYIDYTNATDSNHDVEVVGWGFDKETNLKYWLARNSCQCPIQPLGRCAPGDNSLPMLSNSLKLIRADLLCARKQGAPTVSQRSSSSSSLRQQQ